MARYPRTSFLGDENSPARWTAPTEGQPGQQPPASRTVAWSPAADWVRPRPPAVRPRVHRGGRPQTVPAGPGSRPPGPPRPV